MKFKIGDMVRCDSWFFHAENLIELHEEQPLVCAAINFWAITLFHCLR